LKLYIITFIPCDTQFLVNQKTKENALKSAISANKLVGDVEGEKMDDEKLYLVNEVTKMSTIAFLFNNWEYWGQTSDTIILD
jgi:hypothetical protein